MNFKRLSGLALAAPALLAVVYCGSSDSNPPTTPAPGPTVAPTAPPPPVVGPLVCDPTPPPLRSIRVNVHQNSGNRKTLDSTPRVVNVDDYCARTGQGGTVFCNTRREGDPQREDCDRMALGMARDTGRYGPTWFFDGGPCGDISAGQAGCNNHPDNQFLVIAKGTGIVAACSNDVPTETGARVCGQCAINPASGRCP